MTTLRYSKKQDLRDALEGVRRTAKRLDAAAKRDRAKDVDKAAKKLKANLAKRKGWTVKEWARVDYHVLSHNDRPDRQCARSLESQIDAALGRLHLTKQERFTINRSGENGRLWLLLTLDVPEETTICG